MHIFSRSLMAAALLCVLAFGAPSSALAQTVEKPASFSKDDFSPPNVALSEDVLFQILAAELAQQRGELPASHKTLMKLAETTRDPRLARRALEVALQGRSNPDAWAALNLWRTLVPIESGASNEVHLAMIALALAGGQRSSRLREIEPQMAQWLASKNEAQLTQAAQSLGRAARRANASNAEEKLRIANFFESLFKPYANLTAGHLLLAELLGSSGDKTRAISEALAALKLNPNSEPAALAVMEFASANPDEARAALQRYTAQNDKNIAVRYAYGRMLVDAKQVEAGRAEFEKIVNQFKEPHIDAAESYFALGMIDWRNQQAAKATEWFTKFVGVVEANPKSELDATQAYLSLAQIAQSQQQTDAALSWLKKIPEESRNLVVSLEVARTQALKGDVAGARATLAAATVNNAHDKTQIALLEAQILRNANLQDEAFLVLSKAVQSAPQNTELLYDFALVSEKLGKFDLMESTLRQVIALKPDMQHAYNALGYSFAERNINLPEALQLIEKALSFTPEDAFILDSLGWVQYRMGDLNAAIATLLKAHSLRQDAEIGAHLGEVLWQKGQKEEAQKIWREAFARDNNNEVLNQTREKFGVK